MQPVATEVLELVVEAAGPLIQIFVLDKWYPILQVRATVLDVQVAAFNPQA